jgi:hypothetical protein
MEGVIRNAWLKSLKEETSWKIEVLMGGLP